MYAVPDPAVGDQVMAALVLAPGAEFDADKFRAFLAEQTDLGPKQWPSYVRVSTELAAHRDLQGAQAPTVGRGCGLWGSGVAGSPVDMTSRPLETALEASFDQLSASVPADVGIAIARSDRPIRWADGRPVSHGRRSRCRWRSRRCAAIGCVSRTLSSRPSPNPTIAASEQLWSGLGDPGGAARRVQGVIAEGGDTATVVESRRLRRGYTAFGQTEWTLQRPSPVRGRAALIPRRPRHRPDARPDQRSSLGPGRQRLCRERWLGARNRTTTTWSGSSASSRQHPAQWASLWRPKFTTACTRPASTSSIRWPSGSSTKPG